MTVQSNDLDWIGMAGGVVKRARISGPIQEEAVQETALAGWIAATKWCPDGGMSLRTWVWQQMERGLVDWLRLRLGRSGQKLAWDESLKYLDDVLRDGVTPCGALIPAENNDYSRVEQGLDLLALIRAAGLDERELETVVAFLIEEPLRQTGARWGVTEARACQVKGAAFDKIRAAA